MLNPLRSSPCKFVPHKKAPAKSAPCKLALRRSAPVISLPLKLSEAHAGGQTGGSGVINISGKFSGLRVGVTVGVTEVGVWVRLGLDVGVPVGKGEGVAVGVAEKAGEIGVGVGVANGSCVAVLVGTGVMVISRLIAGGDGAEVHCAAPSITIPTATENDSFIHLNPQ